jgi:hypothetical protein
MSAPNQAIHFEVSKEFYDRFVDKLVFPLHGSVEEVVMFLLGQALEAPESAIRWMTAKRLHDVRPWEGNPVPSAKSAYEAYGDAIRDDISQRHRPALNLAEAVRAVL